MRTQDPSVGLYRFATAFPGHREHVALQRQSFASVWSCRHTPFRGFQNVREARPITTQNPSVGLYRFATAFPRHREHVALHRQPFASAWPCRHTPFRGFQNVCEARPITTQNPSVGLYRFATAFPGHRTHTHVALQRQPCASAWPCRHNPFTALPLLPRSPRTRCPAAAALCQRLAMSPYSPFRGCQNVCEARPITTQNPSVGLYRFARSPHTRCPAAAPCATAWPCRHNLFTAWPLLSLFTASAWPLPLCHCRLASRHTPFRGFRG